MLNSFLDIRKDSRELFEGLEISKETAICERSQVAGGNVFTFFTCQRAVVYDEVHGNGRLGDFLERDGNRVVQIAAESISDVDIRDTGNSNDRTDACLSNLYTLYAVGRAGLCGGLCDAGGAVLRRQAAHRAAAGMI